MDTDAHGIVVGMVGFSMALLGFVLSLVAPVVHSVYPRFHQQLPAMLIEEQGRHRARQRIVSPAAQDAANHTPPIERHPSLSASGSAESVATADSSSASSATNVTSLLSEERGRKEEVGPSAIEKVKGAKEAKRSASAASPCTPRAYIARVAGIRSRSYSKPKRAGSSSTVASASSADVADGQQPIDSGHKTSSPTSSVHNLASRSSSEIDVNYVLAPLSPARSQQNEGKEESRRKANDRPRPLSRAKTFFNLGRSSSKRRQVGPTIPPPSGPLPPLPTRAATFDDSHSAISTEHPVPNVSQQFPFPRDHITSKTLAANEELVNEHGVLEAGDEGQLGLERSRSITISCLGKLKGKKKASTRSLSTDPHSTRALEVTESIQDEARSPRPTNTRSQSERPSSLRLSPDTVAPNTTQVTSPASKKLSKKSNSPPSRTRPYEAPYFFPMPTSPDAVDYVRRTRNEFARAHSSLSPQERPTVTQVHGELKVITSKADKRKSDIVSSDRDMKTAPAHRVGFHLPLHFHRSHKRATSLSSPISPPQSPTDGHPEADQMGFVRPAQDLRVRTLKDETAPLTAKAIARSATLPGNDWPSKEDPSRPLRPSLSVKGASH